MPRLLARTRTAFPSSPLLRLLLLQYPIDALENIGTPEAVRALGRVFPLEGREETKLRAVEGIRWIGFDARDDAVAELIRALSDPSDEVRRMASAALVALEEPAVVAQLYEVYRDPATDDRARGALAVVLRRLGESSIPAPDPSDEP